VQAKAPESGRQEDVHRLGRVTVTTMLPSEPVSDLGAGTVVLDPLEPGTTEDLSVRATHDRQRERATGAPSFPRPPQELSGVFPGVRIRDVQRASRDRGLVHQADERLHVARVRESELDAAAPQRKAKVGEPFATGRSATGQSVLYLGRGEREDRRAKLRYIRDGVGWRDMVRYLADLFWE